MVNYSLTEIGNFIDGMHEIEKTEIFELSKFAELQ
jgi:hypothetical protein